jgi:hypothetical protein
MLVELEVMPPAPDDEAPMKEVVQLQDRIGSKLR